MYLAINIVFDRMYINLGINGVLVINLETKKIVKIPINHPFSVNKAHIICHHSGEIHFISCWVHVKWTPHLILFMI